MKQFQFEVKHHNNLRKELARVKRFAKNEYHTAIVFQILTTLEDFEEIKKITDIIEQDFPDAFYYGCQTYGNIFEGALSKQSTMIVSSVFEFESTKSKAVYIDPMDTDAKYQSLQDLWDFCNENDWVKGVELIPSYKGAEILGVGKPIDNLREDVQVFGGIAINPHDMKTSNTYIFAKGHKPSETAAMAALVGGPDLFVDTDYVSGWEGLGKTFSITSCSGKRIHQIDNEPAMDIYRNYLGVKQDEKFSTNAIAFPLLVRTDNIDCIRIPFSCENKDEYDFVVDVERGMTARLSYGEKSTILRHVKGKIKQIAKFAPDTIRIYSCATRRAFWGDEEVGKETSIFDDIASTVGFYTRGEILRVGNYLHYFNSTMVFAIIREGDAYEYSYDIDKIIDDEDNGTNLAPKLINYIGAVTGELQGQFNATMKGIASIYRSMFLIDMEEKVLIQLDANEKVAAYLSEKENYFEKMKNYLRNIVVEDMLYQAMIFCDFHTIKPRLRYKNFVDCELISKEEGWFRAQFVVVNRNSGGMPTQFVFTSQVIDDEKRKEEKLIQRAITDELTGLYNRRAYEMDLREVETKENAIGSEFAIVAIDVNGLKKANDSIGHEAGDELIIGAAECIKRSFSPYGKTYRIGGDEFAAVLYIDREQLEEVKMQLQKYTDEWCGELVSELSISCGYVYSGDFVELSVQEMTKVADKEMYHAKEAYYRLKGEDRRSQRNAYDILCQSYTKILKVNLTEDTYDIIKAEKFELDDSKGYEENSISKWLYNYALSGQICEEDREKYIEKTGIEYLRDYFESGNKIYSLHYKRRIGEEYKEVMMEMMPTNEFSSNNMVVFLYVKNISE